MKKLTLSIIITIVSLFTFSGYSSACEEPTYDYVPYTVLTFHNGTYTAADTQGNTITFTNGDIREGDNIKTGDIVNALYNPYAMSGLNGFLAIEKEYGTYNKDHSTITYLGTLEAVKNGYYHALIANGNEEIILSSDMVKGLKLGDNVYITLNANVDDDIISVIPAKGHYN
jgi:hypothetical protein